jgi:hypothetical protein
MGAQGGAEDGHINLLCPLDTAQDISIYIFLWPSIDKLYFSPWLLLIYVVRISGCHLIHLSIQHKALHKHYCGSASSTINSGYQAIPLYSKAESTFKHNTRFKSAVSPQENEFFIHPKGDRARAQSTCEAEYFLKRPIKVLC